MARTINGCTQDTISLSSTSTGVIIIPPGTRAAGWVMENESDSTSIVWVFMLNGDGSMPSVPPAIPRWQLAPGQSVNDQLVAASSGVDTMLNLGWGAVLKSAGSATVDVIYR